MKSFILFSKCIFLLPPSSSEPALSVLDSAAYEFPWIPNNPDPEIGLSKRLDPSTGFDNPLNSPPVLAPLFPNNPELNNPPVGFVSSFFASDKNDNPDPFEDEDRFAKRPVPVPAPKRLVGLVDPNRLLVVFGKLLNNDPVGFVVAAAVALSSLVSEVFLFSKAFPKREDLI